jgi:hypothetical protein
MASSVLRINISHLKKQSCDRGDQSMKHSTMISGVLAAVMMVVAAPGWAEAKQTSLDSRIIEAFENIDGRTNSHEQNVIAMRTRLDNLAQRLKELRTKLANMPSDTRDRNARKRRRTLHGKIINASAEYLNQSYKLVDSAAAVISANLSDLAKLADAVRRSPASRNGALRLQKRVKDNIANGKSMRSALLHLRNWAKTNPDMVGRFQSLKRLTQALDRRVSIDKARLKSRHVDATGAVRSKRQEALDRSVDRLGDMYAEVKAEKESLKDLRDELSIAIQMGRMEMTQEVAERAIPRVDSIKGPTSGVDSLEDMAMVIGELNSSMVAQASVPSTVSEAGTELVSDANQPANLKIGGFSNF